MMNKLTIFFALALAAIFISCNQGKETGRSKLTSATDFIPMDSANKMISSYLNSINYSVNDSSLQSIIIDMDQLRLYCDSTNITNRITHVKLMFAHNLSYINAGHINQPCGYNSNALTLILAGVNSAGNYVYFNTNMVIDHSSPCPHNCPEGNAANPLLVQLSQRQ
jgi:hypothetical protein